MAATLFYRSPPVRRRVARDFRTPVGLSQIDHDPTRLASGALNSWVSAERSKGRRFFALPAPTCRLRHCRTTLDRWEARDPGLKRHWAEAAERRRQQVNQELKQGLWILGSIGSASPFIGLFGTVVGILQAFRAIATTGSGGFGVVAAGISEALIATALGVVIAVIAVMAYNALQTRSAHFVFLIRQQTEELLELLAPRQVQMAAAM